jgi:GH25 family lysozyme M1 (1,4-beta-N-acetylmuramidase)
VFCREVGRLMKSRGHYHTFVYANPDVINLGWCHMLAGYRLWVADYGVPHPPMPLGPWRTWTFWQRSGAAPLDLDVFNGTAEQLQALVSW